MLMLACDCTHLHMLAHMWPHSSLYICIMHMVEHGCICSHQHTLMQALAMSRISRAQSSVLLGCWDRSAGLLWATQSLLMGVEANGSVTDTVCLSHDHRHIDVGGFTQKAVDGLLGEVLGQGLMAHQAGEVVAFPPDLSIHAQGAAHSVGAPLARLGNRAPGHKVFTGQLLVLVEPQHQHILWPEAPYQARQCHQLIEAHLL